MMNGKIVVITGSMFSGKTTMLMNEYDKSIKVGIPIIFKPSLDNRYSSENIVTHDKESRLAIVCRSSNKIFEYLSVNKLVTDVFIDEAQFFDDDIVGIVDWCRNSGINVFLAVLNQTFLGEPFCFSDSSKHVGELLCLADDIVHLKSRCVVCGEPASKTYLKASANVELGDSATLIGGSELYEPRCFRHHNKERF